MDVWLSSWQILQGVHEREGSWPSDSAAATWRPSRTPSPSTTRWPCGRSCEDAGFKFLKIREKKIDFPDFGEIERLVESGRDEADRRAMILLGAEASLRIDYRAGNITIWENDWEGNVGSTKAGDRRTVPMTSRLRDALPALRHLRGGLVLCDPDGKRWTKLMVRAALRTICRRAGVRVVGAHVLRHAFCSHLAIRGAAPKAIQEPAGHKSLNVTLPDGDGAAGHDVLARATG